VAGLPLGLPGLGDVVVPIFGRVPARQSVPAGAYTDSVTVTINF
jgi:spore coat protein U-like protein